MLANQHMCCVWGRLGERDLNLAIKWKRCPNHLLYLTVEERGAVMSTVLRSLMTGLCHGVKYKAWLWWPIGLSLCNRYTACRTSL